MIMTRAQWDEATAAGHVTPEHVMLRLRNIADHIFGVESGIGYDEDGFVIGLTSAGLALQGGVILRVFPNDHAPPHVHIEVSSHPHAKIRINLATGDLLDDPPRGLPTKKLKRIQALVHENRAALATSWEKYHGGPVVFS